MNKIEFYKSIFDREQTRRNALDNSVNQPITLVTILVGFLYFLYSKVGLKDCSLFSIVVIVAMLACIGLFLVCTYYLALSFNNLLKGFDYKDFPKTQELFDYDKKVESYNLTKGEDQKLNFEKYLIEKYVAYSDSFVEINDKRALNLHKAKKFLIALLAIEIITVILLLTKNLL